VAKRSEPSSWLQQAGLLTAIPIVLLVGPVLGYYLGTAADRRWASDPWGLAVGIALGLAASLRVTLQMIRRSSEMDRNGQPHDG